ncbi:hypothetical protein WDU94_000895 [Cyamophila willieti]
MNIKLDKKPTPEPTVTTQSERTISVKRTSDTIAADNILNTEQTTEDKNNKTSTNEKDIKHVESIRRGINNLLREFKKENINVATLMDQDGRIFFSIDMTVIINHDEELHSIVKAVQKSMDESSNRIFVNQNSDEVAKKLRRHFLFESNKEVNVGETQKLESVEKKETHQSHSEIETPLSMKRNNFSEDTLMNNDASGDKLISISADETELTSLLYSYVKKMDKTRKPISNIPVIIKREKGEKGGNETESETKRKKTRNRAVETDLKLEHKGEKNIRSDSKEKRHYKRKHLRTECMSSREVRRQQETKRDRYKRESIEYIKQKIRKKVRKRSKIPESENRKESDIRKHSEKRSRRRHGSRRKLSRRKPSIERSEEHRRMDRHKEYKERREKVDKIKVLETVSVGDKNFTEEKKSFVEKKSSKNIEDNVVTKDSESKIDENVIQSDVKEELRDNTDLKQNSGDSGKPLDQDEKPTKRTKSNEIRNLLEQMIEQCPHLTEMDVGGSSEQLIAVTSFERSS